jgi:hypothetical protein
MESLSQLEPSVTAELRADPLRSAFGGPVARWVMTAVMTLL